MLLFSSPKLEACNTFNFSQSQYHEINRVFTASKNNIYFSKTAKFYTLGYFKINISLELRNLKFRLLSGGISNNEEDWTWAMNMIKPYYRIEILFFTIYIEVKINKENRTQIPK